MKKILIAVPSREQIDVDTVNCLRKLELDSMLNKNISVDLHIIQGTIIHDIRQTLAEEAVNGEYDHLLFIDSDMVFNSDVLIDLLECDKDIVSAVCFMRKAPYEPCIYKDFRIGFLPGADEITKYVDYPRDDVFEIQACGLAMCLIKTNVFKKIFEKEGHAFVPIASTGGSFGEDLSFCIRARRCGFSIFANSKPKIGHIGKFFSNEESFFKMKELTS